jgi:hypothetical protein
VDLTPFARKEAPRSSLTLARRASRTPIDDQPTVCQTGLFLRAAITLQNELIKLFCLLRDTVRNPLFVLAAGCRRRLLDKLPKVVSQDRDAIVELRKG